CMQGLEFRHSF
nr:immunoglobulin light chain junction region [Macaca mulatta]